MLKHIMLVWFIGVLGLPAFAQTDFPSFDALKVQATDENKLILINFSGSDWCNPCIRMKNEIFSTPEFGQLMREELLFYNADFPRSKKNRLSKEQTEQNESLAEKYNKTGAFPMTVLIDPAGTIIKSWEGFPVMGKEAFIREIRNRLPTVEPGKKKVYSRTTKLMGNRFDISVVSEDQEMADLAIDSAIEEIRRIERLISSWDEKSQTSEINRNAGIRPVNVDPELYGLIERSKQISNLTQGAFDISFGSIDPALWRFDGTMTALPDSATAAKAVRLINYNNILLDKAEGSVFLTEKGMRIGFGAIGKGYAAEMAKKKLLGMGIDAGVVNASGDMTIWGSHPEHDRWTIGIADPDARQQVFSSLQIRDQAVVTSGNYEKFVMIDGKKYTHIIDPRTGCPASGTKSVTIIAPNAELADALATAVFILGSEVGVDLINQLPGIECIIINEDNQMIYSDGIKIH